MGDIAVKGPTDIISAIVLKGDLSGLSPQDRVAYYNRMCQHVGLDPVTQPFSLLNLQGKQVLYANKSATEQLRVAHGVSVTDLDGREVKDIYIVTAKGVNAKGRTDAATGAVTVAGLKGDALANALMKAETKAKRRLTLSLCGLGMLDETEIETIPDARPTATFDVGTSGLPEEAVGEKYQKDFGAPPKDFWDIKKASGWEAAKAYLNSQFAVAEKWDIVKKDDGWHCIGTIAAPVTASVEDEKVPF